MTSVCLRFTRRPGTEGCCQERREEGERLETGGKRGESGNEWPFRSDVTA